MKKEPPAFGTCCPMFTAEDSPILTQGKCVIAARRKAFWECESQWSIYWNKLELSFSSVTGYQFPVCSWHRCHDDSPLSGGPARHQSSCGDGKLLHHQARWKWHDVQWCGLLFFILHYMGSLNLLLLLADRPTARTIMMPFGANLALPEKYCKHIRTRNTHTDE